MENLFAMTFTPEQVAALSSLGVAHSGGGVCGLLCRSYLCAGGEKTVERLHHDTIQLVKAPAQAAFADRLLPRLTEEELVYYRRGKNAHVHAVPKGATREQYAKATGLEALFGALYLMGKTYRLNELFQLTMDN